MIGFRDFQPESQGFFPKAGRISVNYADALAEANDWISREAIDLINVETVDIGSPVYQCHAIRIWYRSTSAKPDPIPEV